MTNTILREEVKTSAAWKGPDFAHDDSWIYRLSPEEIGEVEAAMAAVKGRGLSLFDVRREDFPLPKFGIALKGILKEIQEGRGFVLLRGFPAGKHAPKDVELAFWGIGAHLGLPVTQNPRGHLMGHVLDEGASYGKINVRGYQTTAHLPFHTDGGDLIGLCCLHPSKIGGKSRLVSSVALHNEILRNHPEYLEPLYRGFHYIRREAALTDNPVTEFRMPVFGYQNGYLSTRLIRAQIDAAAEKSGQPLSPLEKAALDYMGELSQSDAIRLDMDFQVGDMQLINNYTIMHSRTDFEDWPEPERKRHILRLWLGFREPRVLPGDFPRHEGYGNGELVEIAYRPRKVA